MGDVLGDVLDGSFGDDGCFSLFVEGNVSKGHANIVLDLHQMLYTFSFSCAMRAINRLMISVPWEFPTTLA
jgi:hypothetical protein